MNEEARRIRTEVQRKARAEAEAARLQDSNQRRQKERASRRAKKEADARKKADRQALLQSALVAGVTLAGLSLVHLFRPKRSEAAAAAPAERRQVSGGAAQTRACVGCRGRFLGLGGWRR